MSRSRRSRRGSLNEEITFRDVTFPEGTIVMVCAFTGNRDLDGDADGAGRGRRSTSRPSADGRAR